MIPSTIFLDLLTPPLLISLWRLEVRRASMPEASVHEDSDTPSGNYQIRRSWQSLVVRHNEEFASTQFRDEILFRNGISCLLSLHSQCNVLILGRRPQHRLRPRHCSNYSHISPKVELVVHMNHKSQFLEVNAMVLKERCVEPSPSV